MPDFVRSVTIDAPLQVVFGFHEREDALPLLSPKFPPLQVISREGGITKGARVVLRIGFLVKWVALHTAYERDRLFIDEQVEGPMKRWVHRHEFQPSGPDQTILTDRIQYELRGGRIVEALFGWLARKAFDDMFRHRHKVTKDWCEQHRTAIRPLSR